MKIDTITKIGRIHGIVSELVKLSDLHLVTNPKAEFEAIERELSGVLDDLTSDGATVKLTIDTDASFAPEIRTGKIDKRKGKRRKIRLVSPSVEQIAALSRVECEEIDF